MNTSSPTALATYEGICRPGSTAPRRISPSGKGVVFAKKKPEDTEDTEDTVKAKLINKSHVVETPLALPGIHKSFDSWKQEQKQKQKQQQQQQRPSVIGSTTSVQPQQPKSANIHESKKNSRHLRAHLDSVSPLVADTEKKARESTVSYSERSSGHGNPNRSSRFIPQRLGVPGQVRCGTDQFTNPNSVRPMLPPSTGKPERPNQPSPAVVLPPMDLRECPNPPSDPRGVPGPDFFRPRIVSASESKPVGDRFIAIKSHDATPCYAGGDKHKFVENGGQCGDSNGSNTLNNPSENLVFGKLGCTMQTCYDQENDGDVFTLLDEARAANTNTNTNAAPYSSQEAATTGISSLGFTYHPMPWEMPRCQRIPNGLPPATPSAPMQASLRTDAAASVSDLDSSSPLALKLLLPRDNPKPCLHPAEPHLPNPADISSLDNTATRCSTIEKDSARIGNNLHRCAPVPTPPHHASRIRSTLNSTPDLAPATPFRAIRTDEEPNTQISARNRSNSIINPKLLSPTTGCSQLAYGEEGEKELPGTGLGNSALATTFVPDHRRSCPMSLEDTDRLLHSLSTNDLIALCTKCQCELQERGRSFTSPFSGKGNKGQAVIATSEAAATVSPDDGIGIGGGRACKDKRKFGATDSDTEEHTRAASGKTPKQTQQGEEQKSKKNKSEDVSVSPSLKEGMMQSVHYSPAPSVSVNPPTSHLDLQSKKQSQSDGAASAGEDSCDDQQLKKQLGNATHRTVSNSAPAATTEIAAAEPLPTDHAGVDEADDMEWQYVKEDCWKSPKPLCGDVFEMVERTECS